MNDNFQNPLQVLKTQSKEAWSGCIEVEEPKDPSVCWHIYMLEGKILYISSAIGQQVRLSYLWQRFKLGSKCPQLEDKQETSEYVQICQILSEKQLSSPDIKKLLFRFTREGLVNILGIERTAVKLIPSRRIKKPIVSFSLEQLKAKLEEKIKGLKHSKDFIPSPFSRLYLDRENALKFYKIWKPKYSSPEFESISENHKLSSFVSLFVTKSSLYQISSKLKIDTYLLTKHLQESIEQKLVSVSSFKELSPEELKRRTQAKASEQTSAKSKSNSTATIKSDNADAALIVCIDDSRTVQKQVRMTLEAGGYRVLGIVDPAVALKKLSQHQPAVIFLDINMPNINGYDLCSLLRKSQRFKDIPIVMLTGRDGMIDRVRAKIAGATDYLTKPCDPNKLITLTKALENSTVTV